MKMNKFLADNFPQSVMFAISAPVAQLDRASASGAEGYKFEPCRVQSPIRRNGLSPALTRINLQKNVLLAGGRIGGGRVLRGYEIP